MANPSWLDIVESGLRTHWLPGAYRHRAMRELRDHAEDIKHQRSRQERPTEDEPELLARRLGDPKRVATSLVQTYRQRYFAGRHPIVTFVLTPVPVGLVVLALLILGLLLPLWIAHICGVDVYTARFEPYYKLVFSIAYNVMPVGVAALYACLATRSAAHRYALLASTGLLALFFGSAHAVVRLPLEGAGSGMIMIGYRPYPFMPRLTCMIAVVCIFVLVRRYYQQRRQFA